jgi:hypothetical protein
MLIYATATHLNFEVDPLKTNPIVSGSVVDPLDVKGAITVLFSVFTYARVCAAAL